MTTSVPHLQEHRLEGVRREPDAHEWIFVFTGGLALHVNSPWRLVSEAGIELGGEDHAQRFGLPTPVDALERIRAVSGSGRVRLATHDSIGDLAVHFENGGLLQVLNSSAGYEGPPSNRRRALGLASGRARDVAS